MKKLLFLISLFAPCVLFADVNPIDTLSPKNNAFQYIARSTNVYVSTTPFSKNLGTTDTNLQHALQTIDQLNIGGNAAASALGITTGTAGVFSGPVISTPTALIVLDSGTFSVGSVGIGTATVSLVNVVTNSSATANLLSLSSATATYAQKNAYASATSSGVLQASDWSTFNNKGTGNIVTISPGAGITGGGTGPTVTIAVSSVSLSTQTFGNLPVANLNGGLNAMATTYWSGGGTWVAISTNVSAAATALAIFNGTNLISSPTISVAADSSTINTYLIGTSSAGFRVNQASVTVQGNTFNAAGKLVQLTAGVQYPALDGNLITNINASNISGTIPYAALTNVIFSTGTLQSGSTAYPDFIQVGTRLTLPHVAGESYLSTYASSKYLRSFDVGGLSIGLGAHVVDGFSTVIGDQSGGSASATNATYLGSTAGFNDSGNKNTGVGVSAGYGNTNGTDNVFFGYFSGASNTTGSQNTYINSGANSTAYNRTGNSNTFIGYGSGLQANNAQTKRIGLGFNAIPTCDDCGTIGDPTDQSFYLGLGTGNPQAKLDVYGNTRTSTLTVTGQTVFLATTTAVLVSTQNDLNFGNFSVLRATASVAVGITGFAGGVDGRRFELINVGTNTITLGNQNASSSAANRIMTPNGGDFSVFPYTVNVPCSIELWYDAVTQRWRILNH